MQMQAANWEYLNTRRRVRFDCDAQVTLLLPDEATVFGQLRDISLAGMYFYTSQEPDKEMAPGSTGHVRMILDYGQCSLSIECTASTVRVDWQGMALRFAHPLQLLSVFALVSKQRREGSRGKRCRETPRPQSANDLVALCNVA